MSREPTYVVLFGGVAFGSWVLTPFEVTLISSLRAIISASPIERWTYE